jgi:penicillin-binding protein 1A
MWLGGLALAGMAAVAMLLAVALAAVYPRLPDIHDLSDYRPVLPLKVLSAEGAVLGEFGEERRNLTPLKDIPKPMIDAVLASEDHTFYEHGGISWRGVFRAVLTNLKTGKKSQGASTITAQVARNIYLSNDKLVIRKLFELLLTLKLEAMLTKDQILEIYMNQIFLGNRAYGFAAASEIYFGKPLKTITVAEAAILAGLPQRPSAFNPIDNPKRSRTSQLLIIHRMKDVGFITDAQAAAAEAEQVKIRRPNDANRVHAEYIAETVRQLVFAQYGPETYTRGLNVHTTVKAADQEAAYRALRRGIMDYERRQVYRGPEKFVELPTDVGPDLDDAIDEALDDTPDNGDLLSAVVLDVNAKKITASRRGETVEISGDGLNPARSGLADKAPANIKIRRGAVIRMAKTTKGLWEITQLPEVEGAFVAIDPRTGALRALVGGFDFDKNKFNHVTQAWRQPGSSFKPFIYSAALEKGFTGATIINDSPLFFSSGVTGGQAWEPKNYDGKFDGPMSLRTGLAKSKNMISIRIINSIGPQFAQDWVTKFGFEEDKHPPYLTMALGAGSVTPMQMVTGYSVFANGGLRVQPWVITKITEQRGRVLLDAKPPVLDESVRAIDARNAFVMGSLLQEITRSGTAAKAQGTLKRPDLYGKTGTTNDSMDAWFVGFQPTIAAAVWIGYDTPRKMGSNETGGGLSLPVWISFMEHALKGVPVQEMTPPAEGLLQQGGEWVFDDVAKNGAVRSLGLEEENAVNTQSIHALPPSEEKKRILDLFKN